MLTMYIAKDNYKKKEEQKKNEWDISSGNENIESVDFLCKWKIRMYFVNNNNNIIITIWRIKHT